MVIPSSYEEREILDTYLLFHYGSPEHQLGSLVSGTVFDSPTLLSLSNACRYPIESVNQLLDKNSLNDSSVALDLGCALGRSSFALAEHCHAVLGIDYSELFIESAKKIAKGEELTCRRQEEGSSYTSIRISPDFAKDLLSRVSFQQGDAQNLALESKFDVLHAANLLCRLNEPKKFLERTPHLLNPGGQLLLCSPYSWLEDFTPKNNWIGGSSEKTSRDEVLQMLSAFGLELEFETEIPFLIREHARKFQLSVAHGARFRKPL